MLFTIFLAASLLAGTTTTSPLPGNTANVPTKAKSITVIHDFGAGNFIENLALRGPSDILANDNTAARTYLIEQRTNTTCTVATYSDAVSGITETTPDVFYVQTNNATGITGQPGSGTIFKLDMRGVSCASLATHPVVPQQVARVAESGLLNGLTTVNPDILLAADSQRGLIWRIDLCAGNATVFLNDSNTMPPPGLTGPALATNGVHTENNFAYFTNTDRQTYSRVPMDAAGHATGPSVTLSNLGFAPDDFFFAASPQGAYLADESQNSIAYVDGTGGAPVTVAPGVAGPTSVKRRVEDGTTVLYVSTTGGDAAYFGSAPVTVHGTVTKIVLE